MAKYIELVGLPGVGKTATYNFLRAAGKRKGLLFPEDLEMRDSLGEILSRKTRTLFYTVLGKKSIIEAGAEEDLLDRFVQENPELNKMFWESVVSNEFYGRDSKFHVVSYMKKIVERVQRVKEFSSDRLFIVDEGIIHNLNYFTRSSPALSYEEQLSTVLDSADLPEGIVFCGGDLETVVERTMSRAEVLGRDMGLSFQELLDSRKESMEAWKKCLNVIEKKNIPLLFLDAQKGVEEKALEIMLFTSSLAADFPLSESFYEYEKMNLHQFRL